jgi:alpha-glucoside transport system substrate-binding protein
MKKSLLLLLLGVLALLAAVGARAKAGSAAAAASGQLTVIGPWANQDAESFRAVLSGFMAANPGVTVTYTHAVGDVATSIDSSVDTTAAPDLGILPLPADQAALTTLSRAGTLKPVSFALPQVIASYAYSWRSLGTVDGKLMGLFFKARNNSALWYDQKAFASLKLKPPASLADLRNDAATIRAHGLEPFSLSTTGPGLSNLFQSLYLDLQGNQRYDRLAEGKIPWTDPSVTSTLDRLQVLVSGSRAGSGPHAALSTSYQQAVQNVFGSPLKAYFATGGSSVYPLLYSAKAVRPLSRFGVFAFPAIDPPSPPSVIGDADAVVMVKDSLAARALVSYLASPQAATVWAGRNGDFLSPNRGVSATAYAVSQMGTLAESLTAANTFRFGLLDAEPAAFRDILTRQLTQLVQGKTTADRVAHALAAAGSAG